MEPRSDWRPVRLGYRGNPFLICVNDCTLHEQLMERPDEVIPDAEVGDFGRPRCVYYVALTSEGNTRSVTVRQNGRDLATLSSTASAMRLIRSRLRFRIAATSSQHIFVHAGVVAWRGRAIIIPGRTYTGKTTLVVELLRRGATYYSDEYAVIDAGGLVYPFACPLNIRAARQTALTRRPDRLGAPVGVMPVTAGLIVASEYRPGAEWTAVRLSRGNAALTLMANAVAARRYPAQAMTALGRAALSGAAFRAVRGEANAAADAILELFEHHTGQD